MEKCDENSWNTGRGTDTGCMGDRSWSEERKWKKNSHLKCQNCFDWTQAKRMKGDRKEWRKIIE